MISRLLAEQSIKFLRHESSGNHVIKLKWWRIVWITIVSMMKIKPITDYIQMFHITIIVIAAHL